MAIVVRRYSFIGPSNGDLARYVGNSAAQSTLIPIPVVVDLQVNDAVADATTTLDEYMALIGWIFSPAASDPPLKIQDEGASTGPRRPILNFVGAGVGVVDVPDFDRVDVTIPGDDHTVVSRSQYVSTAVQTSSPTFVDGMSGLSVPVPIDGDYLLLFEGEALNQNSAGVMEVALSKNSTTVALADSNRITKGAAADLRAIITTKTETGLVAGDLIRAILRRSSGSGTVELQRRRLTIIKVQ